MGYQRGVFFGVAPYAPSAPFAVKFLRQYEDIDSAGELVRRFRQEDIKGDLPFSVPAKMRPIVCLTEPSFEVREIAALRLANISRRVRDRQLTQEEADEIIAADHDYLFPMPPSAVSAFSKGDTYAAVFDNPVTLHESAITTALLGEIDAAEFAKLCACFVEALDLDISVLVHKRAREITGGGGSQPGDGT